jgi:hypothetical protein
MDDLPIARPVAPSPLDREGSRAPAGGKRRPKRRPPASDSPPPSTSSAAERPTTAASGERTIDILV